MSTGTAGADSTEKVPPPHELAGLHFREWTLAYRNALIRSNNMPQANPEIGNRARGGEGTWITLRAALNPDNWCKRTP
jgi:hypothetical protein